MKWSSETWRTRGSRGIPGREQIALTATAGESAIARNVQRIGAISLDDDELLQLLMAKMQHQDL